MPTEPPSSRTPPTPADRAQGALVGLLVGGAATVRLARVLGEALLEAELDLGRMVAGWTALLDDPVVAADPLAPALQALRTRGTPPEARDAAAASDLAAHVLPIALRTLGQPANLLSGTWHVAAITHPGDEAAWSAVALNVAAARLVQGFRDLVPDVAEALRENAAPATLLERVRRVPITRQHELTPATTSAAPALETVLWLAQREPLVGRALAWLGQAGAPAATRAAAGALFGARNGVASIAGEVPSEAREALATLALRLARLRPA